VTIGICVRNCEKTIDKVIESIVQQDYPHELIELIIVDDGSIDRTLDHVKQLASKISIHMKVYHQNWKGLGTARNVIVRNACRKYIIWVDGDMIIPKNFVTQQVTFMERNPEVGKARAKWGILNEVFLPATLESFRLLKHLFLQKNRSPYLVGIGGSICRTCALKAVGGFDERIRGAGEDIDLTFRLLKSWKIATTDTVFYHRFRKTWKDLWQQYFWYGYGMHYVNSKHRGIVKLWEYLPPVSLWVGLKESLMVIRLTKRMVAILLPLQYVFKNSAWLTGYIKSHFNKYEFGNKQGL
jgi:glycosyltransferase involved in cell wall biosynthesis